MNFFEMVIKLQMVYDQQIILISCGAFYIAIGADAVILNKELKLKTICAKTGVCKVGIPKNSIDKYVTELDKTGYGYIVFDYIKEKNEILKKSERRGKYRKINDFNKGCSICTSRRNINITQYEEAINKYFKQEFGEDCL